MTDIIKLFCIFGCISYAPTASLPSMDPTTAATVIGVLLTVAFGAFATAFAWLRSDLGSRLERLEAKVDGLIMALARSGHLVDPGLSDADD